MGGSAQIAIDAEALIRRTEGAVTYQTATALQFTFNLLLDPELTLACVLLLCIFTEYVSRNFKVDLTIFRQVLLSQLGLSFMSAVDYALPNLSSNLSSKMIIFLLRTYALCLPSVIGAVSPWMLANNYVQTAINSYVYRYAQNSREIVNNIDLGATPMYFCLLCIVVTHYRGKRAKHTSHDQIYSTCTYVFQGLQLLLLDVLTQNLWQNAVGAPKLVRVALTFGLVIAVDLLCPSTWHTLHNVRSYAVLKAGEQINRLELMYLGSGNTFALAIVLLCTRSAFATTMIDTQHHAGTRPLTIATQSIADVVSVASMNVLLQDLLAASVSPSRFVQFLSVAVTAVLVFSIQKTLQSQ